MAIELGKAGHIGCYYSGYPKFKLPVSAGLPVRTHSFRTLAVYSILKYLPEKARPSQRSLFLWQDRAFDKWVGGHLDPCDFIHAMPGQCLQTFRRARTLGARTVLNHASGPARDWVRIMEPEYARIGRKVTEETIFDEDYFAREAEEYALADFHCVASTVVREQLIGLGIPEARIWVVPYGADLEIFFPPPNPRPREFRIAFAGQLSLRKGIRTLLRALELAGDPTWRMDFYGQTSSEVAQDVAAYRGTCPLEFHGALSRPALAEAFRASSVLVLPSLEEAFGLVVPQALNTGLPCLVSDRVGAKDLLRPRTNGSIFPAENPEALGAELRWWETHRDCAAERHDWAMPARRMAELSEAAS